MFVYLPNCEPTWFLKQVVQAWYKAQKHPETFYSNVAPNSIIVQWQMGLWTVKLKLEISGKYYMFQYTM